MGKKKSTSFSAGAQLINFAAILQNPQRPLNLLILQQSCKIRSGRAKSNHKTRECCDENILQSYYRARKKKI